MRPIPDLVHSSIHNRPETKPAIMKNRGKHQNFGPQQNFYQCSTLIPSGAYSLSFFERSCAVEGPSVFAGYQSTARPPADFFVRSAIIGRYIVRRLCVVKNILAKNFAVCLAIMRRHALW